MTAAAITEILFRNLDKHRFLINNLYLYGWESDFFAMITDGKRDQAYEFEIKVTRQDFRKEGKFKAEKHRLLSEHKKTYMVLRGKEYEGHRGVGPCTPIQFTARGITIPNYFYYIAPMGIVPVEEVPPYAGLIEITEEGIMKYVKRAPQLHKEKFMLWRQLADKYYWRYRDMRENINQLKIKLKTQ